MLLDNKGALINNEHAIHISKAGHYLCGDNT